MEILDLQIENYEQRFKKLVGFDVVLSLIWFQYFQMRQQYHAEQLYNSNFLRVLWQAMINPTIIGIVLSSLSVLVCYRGLKLIKEGRKLGKMQKATAFGLTLWWGVFGVMEIITLAIYVVTIRNLTTGLDVIGNLIQTIIDAFRDAF